ncbi:MAG: LptF/LptG family permease [Candidatus Latescibacterota bacterium]|nr:LptF/LptG family permease [Candidatus Latescibacterota bacterium]
MNLHTRYILREHINPFLFGFFLVIFVLVIDVILQFLDRVLSKGIDPTTGFQLLFFNMAWIIALAVPMAVLIATLMAFGRMATDGEILATKACGISFYTLLRPVLTVSFILTVAMILFNDRILPDWNHKARSISSSLQRTKASLALKQREGVFLRSLGGYNLLIRDVNQQNNHLNNITMYNTRQPGPPMTLHATSGKIQFFDNGAYARLTLRNGIFHKVEYKQQNSAILGNFEKQIVHVKDPRRAFERRPSSYRSDREMDVSSMYSQIKNKNQRINETKVSVDEIVNSTMHLLENAYDQEGPVQGTLTTSHVDSVTTRIKILRNKLQKHQEFVTNLKAQIDEFKVEIHKKFSIPAACIVFTLIGAPLGAQIRRHGATVSVAISLSFFWVYWLFLIGGEELADRGFVNPAFAMWAPNIAFSGLGIILIYRFTHGHRWNLLSWIQR